MHDRKAGNSAEGKMIIKHNINRKISSIRSGGQTGVDRGAMDAARECGIPICGWCPKGGWAEDYPEAPGLLNNYPEMTETPLEGTAQRTEWNMRDADAILTIMPEGSQASPGTEVGLVAGERMEKPMLTMSGMEDVPEVLDWIDTLPDGVELCIGGPRESECPGAYRITKEIVSAILQTCD